MSSQVIGGDLSQLESASGVELSQIYNNNGYVRKIATVTGLLHKEFAELFVGASKVLTERDALKDKLKTAEDQRHHVSVCLEETQRDRDLTNADNKKVFLANINLVLAFKNFIVDLTCQYDFPENRLLDKARLAIADAEESAKNTHKPL